MKRLLIVCAIFLVPLAAFAEVQIGATALYNIPYFAQSGPDQIDASDFTFGADARIKIFVFQASGLALFTPGSTDDLGAQVPGTIDLHVDGGIAFDLLLFRLGLGLGPSFRFGLGPDSAASNIGLNVKATAEVMLGSFAVGLTYLNQFALDLDDASQLLDQDYTQGLLGISVLVGL